MFAEYKYALSFDWSKRDWLKKAIMIYIFVLAFFGQLFPCHPAAKNILQQYAMTIRNISKLINDTFFSICLEI